MKKIIYLMGKSASGKDTVYRELLRRFPALKRLIPWTTRPMREGERDGEDYHFTTPEALEEFARRGKLVEKRVYQTVAGPWIYATVDEETDGEQGGAFLGIGTLESYLKLKEYYGADRMFPVYIETDDGVRLQRALDREKQQKAPNYAELCRRYLADQQDFSEEKLKEAGITRRYRNDELSDCLAHIAGDVVNYA